ncbi:hypothetical protein [Sphaerisporangium sp. NPDC051011]|uniref:hypothetical protein n=1 Tax=Sphaerisporangium sp. NPDC051011 TaxID=3155792 RepID=UPI0033F6BC5C
MIDTPADETEYLSVKPKHDSAAERLAITTEPAERARLLLVMADAYYWWAERHTEVYGADLIEEDGVDKAVSLGMTFGLLRALASMETARAAGVPRERAANSTVEARGGRHLDALVTAHGLELRADLYEELHTVLVPVIGSQAASPLWQMSAAYYRLSEG